MITLDMSSKIVELLFFIGVAFVVLADINAATNSTCLNTSDAADCYRAFIVCRKKAPFFRDKEKCLKVFDKCSIGECPTQCIKKFSGCKKIGLPGPDLYSCIVTCKVKS